MLISRFTPLAYSPLFLSALWLLLLALAAVYLPGPDMPAGPLYLFCGLLTGFWLWLMLRELATRICKITVTENAVSVAGFYGLGPLRQDNLSEITDCYAEVKEGRSTSQEYFYLLRGPKKAVILSELYHQNYAQLKHDLKQKARKSGKANRTRKQ